MVTQLASPRAAQSTGYRHEALVWRGIDTFLAHTVPFVAEGLAAGTPTLVAVTREHWDHLNRALGSAAEQVRFVDTTELGHNPARIIPAWLEFIAEHAADGRSLRGVGEPIWAGRRPAEIAECQIHEALLNLAVPADAPLRLLCPFDADALPPAVLDEVYRSHPRVHADQQGLAGRVPTAGHEHTDRLLSQPLPEPTVPTEVVSFGRGDLARVRRLVGRRATAAGLDRNQEGDLVLALNEVAANSLDHGGGSGVVRVWTEPGALVFEVLDAGRIVDPLIGRINPTPHQARGRGLWMVNRLCDLLQIRSTDRGTAVRVVTWLPVAGEGRA